MSAGTNNDRTITMDTADSPKHKYKVVAQADTSDNSSSSDRSAKKWCYDFFGSILITVYALLAVTILVCMIASWIVNERTFYDQIMAINLTVVFLIAVLSIVALVKYGLIQGQIDRLSHENHVFKHKIAEFKETRIRLGQHNDELEGTVERMTEHSNQLEAQQGIFGGLLKELEQIAKDQEEILGVCQDINGTFDRMNDWVYENEKTYLLLEYYEAAYRDDDNSMSEAEWKRFLVKINPKFKAKFEALGDFNRLCHGKKEMDLNAFLVIAEKVLNNSNEMLREEIHKEYRHQASANEY